MQCSASSLISLIASNVSTSVITFSSLGGGRDLSSPVTPLDKAGVRNTPRNPLSAPMRVARVRPQRMIARTAEQRC